MIGFQCSGEFHLDVFTCHSLMRHSRTIQMRIRQFSAMPTFPPTGDDQHLSNHIYIYTYIYSYIYIYMYVCLISIIIMTMVARPHLGLHCGSFPHLWALQPQKVRCRGHTDGWYVADALKSHSSLIIYLI